MDETNDERALFTIEATGEIAWLTGDWLPLWGLIACSTGGLGADGFRHIVNRFADLVVLADRRLRDDQAA